MTTKTWTTEPALARWSRGTILASGTRGPGFKSWQEIAGSRLVERRYCRTLATWSEPLEGRFWVEISGSVERRR